MTKALHARGVAAIACLAMGLAQPAAALVIDHNLAFGAFGQSPFEPGGVFNKNESTFLGPTWTNAPLSLVIPPGCPLELCLRPNLKTSGAFGAEFGYAVSGGKMDFGYPVGARVTLPDRVLAGTPFTVTIDSGVKSGGFGFERATLDANPVLTPWVPLATSGGAKHVPFLNATFPSFSAWLDLVARFNGSIQLRGTAPIVGTGTIFQTALPGFDSKLTVFRLGRDGVATDIAIPGGARSIPFGEAINVIPGTSILTATLNYPDLKPTGALEGAALHATDQRTFADLQLNVLQLLGLGFPIFRALENNIPIGVGNINYSLLKVIAGLSADLRQDLTLTASVKPRLMFDTPVAVIDASGGRSAPTNSVDLPQSGSLQLELANRGSGRLEAKLGYALVAHVENDTSMIVNGRLKASALEAGIDVDIGIKIKESIGPVIGPIGPEGKLFEFPIFESSFEFGLNEILTKAFSIDVDIPSRSLLHTRLGPVGVPTSPLIAYEFRERCGELFCSPERVIAIGFERTDAYGGLVFQALDEIEFTSGTGAPRSYGTLYCVSCVDANLAAEATSSDFVLDAGGSAYINDYLLLPPTGPDCQECVDLFLASHVGASGHVETPLVVEFDRTREFFFGAAAVPVPATTGLLALGLLLMTAAAPARGRLGSTRASA
jgi:hypothetical protein